ncbi:MAG TPA: hypothetical protein VF219_12415 [Vicinamibacterales bacterium]
MAPRLDNRSDQIIQPSRVDRAVYSERIRRFQVVIVSDDGTEPEAAVVLIKRHQDLAGREVRSDHLAAVDDLHARRPFGDLPAASRDAALCDTEWNHVGLVPDELQGYGRIVIPHPVQ